MKIDVQSSVASRRLFDLGKWYGGKTPSKAIDAYWANGTVPWVSPKDMKQPRILDSEDLISHRAVRESGIALVPKGAVLMVIRSGILAHTFPVAISEVPVTINQDLKAFHPFDDVYAPYVAHFLKCQQRNILNGCAKGGTTVPSIDTKSLHDVQVPLPSLKVQRNVVAKIDELFSDLDAGVAALKRAQANLKRYRASVLKAAVEGRLTEKWRAANPPAEPAAKLLERILAERRKKWEATQLKKYADAGKPLPKDWQKKYSEPAAPDVSNLPELPEGWCWATVEQVAEIQSGLQKQPSRFPKINAYPYLRVANVLRGRLDLNEIHKFELFPGELERLRLVTGDLLIVEGNGSASEIGRCAIWSGEIEDCIHQNHIIRVRPILANSDFVNTYWNSPDGSGRVAKKAASTSGLYTLSVSKIASIPVPIPLLQEQAEIVAQVEAALSKIDHAETEIKRSLERAARLRQAILKRAFEGRLI